LNDLATLRPDLAAQWHSTKNGDLLPSQVSVRSSANNVWWQCERGHDWQATPANRGGGKNCPVCSGQRVLAGFNDFASAYPELATEWHPTKNGDLTPSDVTRSSSAKVWWQCAKGHEWETWVYTRSGGSGC